MSTTYIPRPYTIAARVIAYLTEHGGTLDATEISTKFDCQHSTVSAGMRKACAEGLLTAERVGHSFIWSLPPEVAPNDGPLVITLHGDGDVCFSGAQVIGEDGTVLLNHTQASQLAAALCTPHINLTAKGA